MGKRRRQNEEVTEAPASGQVLPIADLGADFDGDADDGATYLALASREAASLPFYTRVEPPSSYTAVEKLSAADSSVTVAVEQGRHPALPRESWEVVNAAHFRAYKAQVARHWPPSPVPECPYPSPPDMDDEDGWRAYIDGADEDDEDDEDEDMDEEAAMNAPPKPARPREGREPLVSLLAGLDTDDVLALLGHFNAWLSDGEEPLSAPWARWIFALLCVLDSRLDSGQQSQLRDLVRTLAGTVMARWECAVADDELQPIDYKEGFYGVQTVASNGPRPGEENGGVKEPQWVLGACWKNARDEAPRSESPKRPPDEEGVDAVLARAWILISAVIAGWGQWDLVDEVNAQIAALPRHS